MDRTLERRKEIFRKTDGRCHLCGARLTFSAYGRLDGWEIEHSHAVSLGGSDRLSNLYAAHVICNREKGTKTTRTVRSWYGRSKAPLSREKKESLRNEYRWGWGTVGALAGGALLGPAGLFIGAMFGAVVGNEIRLE